MFSESSIKFGGVTKEEFVAWIVLKGSFEAFEGGLSVASCFILEERKFTLIVKDDAFCLFDE